MDNLLGTTPLFSALDEFASRRLRELMVDQDLKKGEVLFEEGADGDRLFILIAGKIKLVHSAEDGRESVFMVLGTGDMFGELSVFDPGPRSSTAIAVTNSKVLGLSNADLQPWLAQHPEVSHSLLQALANRLRRANEAMSDLVFADVSGRVAKAIIELGEKFGTPGDDGIHVPHDLTQEELAQLVGASRETVNKALADFATRGWIRVETRSVEIIDFERLLNRAR